EGAAPSLVAQGHGHAEVAVKVCSCVKPVPSVLMANSVPLLAMPPSSAVPYRVLPDATNAATGCAPSAVLKLYSGAKPVPSVLTLNTVPLPPVPPSAATPYSTLPNKIKPPHGPAPSLLVPNPEG